MTHAHDFVGPFIGSSLQVAINLSSVEVIAQDHERLGLTFSTMVGADLELDLTFDTPENYNLAVSILRNKGVLLSTVKIEP